MEQLNQNENLDDEHNKIIKNPIRKNKTFAITLELLVKKVTLEFSYN